MKTTKKILVTASLGAFALATAFGVQAPKTVSAQTSDLNNAKAWLAQSFTMEKGASARIGTDGDGLRFSADWSISETAETALKEAGAKYGMIIAPLDSIPENGTIDANSVFGANSPYYFAREEAVAGKTLIYNIEATTSNIDADEALEMTGAIINLKTQNFVREYVGRAYVAIPTATEGEYEYYFANYYGNDVENNTRSMYYVAQGLIEQNDANKATLQTTYIDGYASIATQYAFAYKVNHHYNDSVTTETLWGTLNETVNVADVLEENASFGYDVAEQTAKNAKTSGRIYAGGRVALDVYYSQKIDTTEVVFEDVALAKASTFTGVTATTLPEGVKDVTYTYDNSATVPTTAGKYEAKANFTVSGEYEYLTPQALTASVRLVSDNATIGAHGANGFEINFTLSNQTATATDWKVNNDVYWAAGDYEEALNNSAYAVNGVSHIQMTSNTLNKQNMGTWKLRAEASGLEHDNRKASGSTDYFGGDMSKLTETVVGLVNSGAAASYYSNYYKSYITTEGDVSYMNFKWRVVPTETGSTVTLYVDCGDNSGWIIYGLETDKKFDTAGYAGLRYNDTLEGVSYISNFSVTELTAGFVEKAPTVQKNRSTNIEMYYTLAGGSISDWMNIIYNGTSHPNLFYPGVAVNSASVTYATAINIGANTITAPTTVTWSGADWVEGDGKTYDFANGGTFQSQTINVGRQLRSTTYMSYGNNTFSRYVLNNQAKFMWKMYNVTEGDTTTMTLEMWLMHKTTGQYEQVLKATGLGALQNNKNVGVAQKNFTNVSVIKDFKVVSL